MTDHDEHAALRTAMLRNLKGVRNATETTFYEDVLGFYHAVDWSERWIHTVRERWIHRACHPAGFDLAYQLLRRQVGAFHLFVWALFFSRAKTTRRRWSCWLLSVRWLALPPPSPRPHSYRTHFIAVGLVYSAEWINRFAAQLHAPKRL